MPGELPDGPTPAMRVCQELLLTVARDRGAARGLAAAFDAPEPADIPLADYLLRWEKYTHLSDEDIIYAVVYIDRLCEHSSVVLTRQNMHRILLCATLAAAKFRDEKVFLMSHYAAVGGVELQELLRLELYFLVGLGWRLYISREEVQKYHTTLRRHPAWREAPPACAIASDSLKPSPSVRVQCRG